jgi:hypothetical protein
VAINGRAATVNEPILSVSLPPSRSGSRLIETDPHRTFDSGSWEAQSSHWPTQSQPMIAKRGPFAHGLIAKIPRTRRWRVTRYGRQVMGTSVYLREHHFPNVYAGVMG